GELRHLAELHRLRGECLRLADVAQAPAARRAVKVRSGAGAGISPPSEAALEAERSVQNAIGIPPAQGAPRGQVRASHSPGRLWLAQQRADEAERLLSPIGDWLTEGSDTVDFRERSALLRAIDASRRA